MEEVDQNVIRGALVVWQIANPLLSPIKDMVPLVIFSIPLSDDVNTVMEELRHANPSLDIAGDLRQVSRIKRWNNSCAGKGERVLSSAILLRVTSKLAEVMLEQKLLELKNRWLPVTRFNRPVVACMRCSQKNGHIAIHCRNSSKCRIYHDEHDTRECTMHAQPEAKLRKSLAPTEERRVVNELRVRISF